MAITQEVAPMQELHRELAIAAVRRRLETAQSQKEIALSIYEMNLISQIAVDTINELAPTLR